jgi:hypothetical protein
VHRQVPFLREHAAPMATDHSMRANEFLSPGTPKPAIRSQPRCAGGKAQRATYVALSQAGISKSRYSRTNLLLTHRNWSGSRRAMLGRD